MLLYKCCTSFLFRSLPDFVFVATLAAVGCSTLSSPQAPAAKLQIPPGFRNGVVIHHFERGEKVVDRGFLEMTALASMTRYEGYWGSPQQYDRIGHSSWWIDIYGAGSPRVVAAYAQARDGYEANLEEWSDFFSTTEQTGPVQTLSYMSARFERKHFAWGDAVSFLSQGSQDTGIYIPCTYRFLTYEIWGVTTDRRYTVVMHTLVSNPHLPECKDVRTVEALKNNAAYKYVEICAAEEFLPSLTAVDRFIDSLQVK